MLKVMAVGNCGNNCGNEGRWEVVRECPQVGRSQSHLRVPVRTGGPRKILHMTGSPGEGNRAFFNQECLSGKSLFVGWQCAIVWEGLLCRVCLGGESDSMSLSPAASQYQYAPVKSFFCRIGWVEGYVGVELGPARWCYLAPLICSAPSVVDAEDKEGYLPQAVCVLIEGKKHPHEESRSSNRKKDQKDHVKPGACKDLWVLSTRFSVL